MWSAAIRRRSSKGASHCAYRQTQHDCYGVAGVAADRIDSPADVSFYAQCPLVLVCVGVVGCWVEFFDDGWGVAQKSGRAGTVPDRAGMGDCRDRRGTPVLARRVDRTTARPTTPTHGVGGRTGAGQR